MEATPVPVLEKFKSKMIEFGRKHGQALAAMRSDPTISEPNHLYYDATKVFLDLKHYLGGDEWQKYATAAKKLYAEWALARSGRSLVGYWVFTEGLSQYLAEVNKTDAQAKAALTHLATRSAFAAVDPSSMTDYLRSRENAYLLLALLDTNSTNTAKIQALADNCYSHMDQWFGRQSAAFVKSFMVGLTSYSMIRANEREPRKEIVSVLANACDELWRMCWVEDSGAFKYVSVANADGETPDPAPDVNQLIAPMYAWVWRATGNQKYLDQADKIFMNGVERGWLGGIGVDGKLEGAKQFNQAHRFVFHYLDWRGEGFATAPADSGELVKVRAENVELQKQITAVANENTQLRNKLIQVREIVA